MLKKILKFGAATAILGGGLFASDELYFRLVHKNLPDKLTNWFAMSRFRTNCYRYGVGAAGALVLVPLVAGVLGLSGKSPIKDGASPVK